MRPGALGELNAECSTSMSATMVSKSKYYGVFNQSGGIAMSFTRREVLTNSSKLAFGIAAGMTSAQEMPGIQPAEKSSAGKFRILVCGGHPGDPEYGCGGTIARLTSRYEPFHHRRDGEEPYHRREQHPALALPGRPEALQGADHGTPHDH